jgi:hypothetical protein
VLANVDALEPGDEKAERNGPDEVSRKDAKKDGKHGAEGNRDAVRVSRAVGAWVAFWA